MNIKLISFLVVCILTLNQLISQEGKVQGFWEIEKVSVGDQQMTPVAKWTKINNDGTFQSGNGWLQSSAGTWNFDSDSKTFASIDELGLIDEFGGFEVSFASEKMIWKREEEGMQVEVSLRPIKELPMSPADYLEGLWDLFEITKNQVSFLEEYDKEGKHKLLIRWDRIYNDFTPEGNKKSGYWHIHGHRPEVTFLPHQDDQAPNTWSVSVNHESLIMTGISDSNRNIIRTYKRQNKF